MKTIRILQSMSLLVTALVTLSGVPVAQAVVNDNFASALTITSVPYTDSSSNADATSETDEPYHYGSTNAHSVWYVWTAASSGPMQLSGLGSSIRTVVAVYTGGSVSGLTPVASGRGNHLVNFAAVVGTTYRIALDSLDAGSFGSFKFSLSPGTAPPANDAFASATTITGSSYALASFSNNGATKEPGEPGHAGNPGGKSLWWQWTAPTTGRYQLDTTGSLFDTLLAVYTGSAVGSLSLVASNDNSGGVTSLVAFDATAGTTYHFAVDGWEGREGQGSLNLNPPPPNDNFSIATVLVGSTVNVSNATSVAATLETGEPLHAGNSGGHSVWFRWTAPASGQTQVDTMGSGFDTLLGVYTGTQVNNLTTVASNDNSPTNLQSLVTFTATAGTTYSIAVDGWNGASGSVVLHVTGQTPTGPLNDYFANATVVTGTTYSITNASTMGATLEPGEPNHNNLTGGTSVWWAWTAPFTGPAQVDTLGTPWWTILAVYTGSSVSNLTLVGSVWGYSVNFNATSGTVYRIAVDAYMGSGGNFNLNVQPGPPPPSNDNFTSALVISSFPYATNVNNVSASKEAGEPNHNGSVGGKSVWWQWTAAASGRMQINTTPTVVGIYTGSSVGSLTSVASGYGNHTVYFQATAGTTYMIAVDDSHGMGGNVNFSLDIAPAPPANDPFASAVVLSGSVCNVSNVSNVAASKESGEPSHAGDAGGKSVWWRWTAPASGQTQVDTIGSGFDTILGVYTGSSVFGLTEIASDDQSGGSNTSKTTFNAVAGTTYYIAVDGWHAQEGNIVLNITPSSGGSYNDWALTYFTPEELPTIGAFDVDADGDGVPNGIESVLGGDPRDAGSAPRTHAAISDVGGAHLVIHFDRAENVPTDVTIIVQVGAGLDPGDWSPLATKSGADLWSGSGTVEEGVPAGGVVPVSVHAPPGGGPRQFLRVLAERIVNM